MRLTVEQRMRELEREVIVLQETVQLLHRLLKEHKLLIENYVLEKMAAPRSDQLKTNQTQEAEIAAYTFICQHRLNRLETDVVKLRQIIEQAQ